MSVKEYRLKNKTKIKEICNLLNINRITFYQKEKGNLRFSLEEAKKIADFYNDTIENIFFKD